MFHDFPRMNKGSSLYRQTTCATIATVFLVTKKHPLRQEIQIKVTRGEYWFCQTVAHFMDSGRGE